jgi:benzoate membrane transport protein
LSVLMDALRKATQSDLPMGAFFALAIAASRVTLLGIGAAFWALIGGLAVSFCLERPALRRAWQTA